LDANRSPSANAEDSSSTPGSHSSGAPAAEAAAASVCAESGDPDIEVDGCTTDDHHEMRHTHASLGWAPIERRMPAKQIRVTTVRELVAALGSDRTIVLAPGNYVWRDGFMQGDDDPSTVESTEGLSPHFRGGVISGVRNLTIAGEGTGPRIVQPDSYDHVLSFLDVEGLTLYNLVLGHHVVRGWCRGGVVRLMGARDVVIDGVDMFGSGTEGLSVTDVDGLHVERSVVWGCSEQLSTFVNAQNVTIRDSVFMNNGFPEDGGLLRGFTLSHAAVVFDAVDIRDNAGVPGERLEGYGSLFTIDPPYDVSELILYGSVLQQRVTGPADSRVVLRGGRIERNTFARLSDLPQAITSQGGMVVDDSTPGWR
jgi:hypothetical protein